MLEFNNDIYEVTSSRSTITLNTPLPIGLQILRTSKLILFRTYRDFFCKFLDPELFEIAFRDT